MAEKWPDALSAAAARWKSGDADAPREVWELCGGRMLRLARAVTGADASADDAAQEAFIRIWRNIGRYDDRREFGPWMTAILVRECRRHAARAKRGRLIPLPAPAPPRGPVLEAVGRLPGPLREIVALYYLEGYGAAEAAALLGIPEGTAKSRLHRARIALARDLKEGDSHA